MRLIYFNRKHINSSEIAKNMSFLCLFLTQGTYSFNSSLSFFPSSLISISQQSRVQSCEGFFLFPSMTGNKWCFSIYFPLRIFSNAERWVSVEVTFDMCCFIVNWEHWSCVFRFCFYFRHYHTNTGLTSIIISVKATIIFQATITVYCVIRGYSACVGQWPTLFQYGHAQIRKGLFSS